MMSMIMKNDDDDNVVYEYDKDDVDGDVNDKNDN